MCEITPTPELGMQKIKYVVHYLLGANLPSGLPYEVNSTLIKLNQINAMTSYRESCKINQTNNIPMLSLIRNM